MLKASSLAITNSYQSLGTILDAQTNKPYGTGRKLTNGIFKNVGANPIRLSVGNKFTEAGNDDVSVLLSPGDIVPFDEINLAITYAKTTASTSTLEVRGEG